MTPGDTPSHQAPDDDDDILDLEIEDVLDLTPDSDSASASAIEGVEMLDFLDDDEQPSDQSGENTDAAAPLDMTIDMASPRADDASSVADAEIENIDELEAVDVTDLGEDQIDVVESREELSSSSDEIVEVESLEFEDETPTVDGDVVRDELDATDVEEVVVDEVEAEPVSGELVEPVADTIDDVEEVVDAVDEIESDDFLGDPAETEDVDEDMFAGLETGDATVNHKREPTTVTENSDSGAAEHVVESTEPNVTSAPASIDEIEEEFALRDDDPAEDVAAASAANEDGSPQPPSDLAFAAAVSPASTAARPKKKSSLPLILIVLFAFLLLGGAGVGGLYFAGMLPGTDGGPIAHNPPDPNGGASADGVPPDAGNQLVDRINAAQDKLLELYRSSRAGEQIDGEKLAEAQQLLTDLEQNDAAVFAEEPIKQHKARFDELAKDFAKQERNNAEAERARKFRDALEFAAANAPKSLDAGALEEARSLANKDELKQIAALEQQVADYQAEQARLAAAEMKAKQQAAFDAIVAAVAAGSSVEYGEMLAAYAADYPEASPTTDLEEVAKGDPAAFDVVVNWHGLLAAWSALKLSNLKSETATAMVEAAQGQLDAGAAELPGVDEVTARLTLLRAVANREQVMEEAFLPLAGVLASPPTKATFIFATQDGHRYYTADKPTKNGDNYVVNRFVDLAGKTESIELAPGDADRTVTGAATVVATAKAVDEALQKIDPSNVDAPLWEAVAAVLADEKLDPVIQVQWLVALAEAGGKVSPHLAKATAPYSELRKTGVDGAFNWADAAAAAKVRTACQEALAALPKMDDLKKHAAEELASKETFTVTTRLLWVAVLKKGTEGEWTAIPIEGAPSDTEVFVVVKSDDGLARVSVGELKDGQFAAADSVDATLLRQGRILYAELPATDIVPASE